MKVPIKQYARLLITYLKPEWQTAILLAVLLLGGIGLELLNPQVLGAFIDLASAGGSAEVLVGLAVLFIAIALVTQVVTVAETTAATNIGLTATNRLRADLALHCLRLDLSFHNAHTPGELIERVDGDVGTLGNFFSRFIVHMIGNAILLAGVLLLLFRIDWRVGLAMTVFAIAALAVVIRLRDVAVPYWAAARQASANLFGFLEERLSGTEDIRANGAVAYAMRRLVERSREVLHRELRAAAMGMATGSLTIVLFAIGTAVGLGLGATLFLDGAISIGMVYLIFNYSQLLSRPIEQITRQMQDLQQAGACLGRIQVLLSMQSAVNDGVGVALPGGALSVELQDVSFGYDDQTNDEGFASSSVLRPSSDQPTIGLVVRDISFRLEPGKVLGLLGRTGSGKTTLTRLLFRLYDPTHGALRLGGVDLRDAHLADVRQRVGMVTQAIQLFHAAVRDNLTFFDSSIPDEKIVRVLYELGLGDWYESLPNGLDTKLASGGSGLSAGEAQLLAFARVFLKDPSVVVLDEASSRLDPASERRLEGAVDKLLQGRTVIIIAHRLGTVQRADHIMILQDGRIDEYGPREQLARDPHSRFAELLRVGLEETLV